MKDSGKLYAVGRVVLFAPKGSPLAQDLSAHGLRTTIASGALKHFAIAYPEHAPYGRAAQEWLTTHGLWESVRALLVLGENATQAAQFATAGDSQGGIIPYSLVRPPRISETGTFVLLSDMEHEPLQQRMALVKNASATAEAFYAYMQSRPAREVMRRYGFVLPDESP